MTTGQNSEVKALTIVDQVSSRINLLQRERGLVLPKDYNAENALRSAWLVIQEMETSDKKPVAQHCSQISITNAMLDMVIQGLNPVKDQCYFIPYGNKLRCLRSYHGSTVVAKREADVLEVYAEVVYEGDSISYDIQNGIKSNFVHKVDFKNIGHDITHAYAIVYFHDEQRPYMIEVMTWDQIQSSWKKSQMYGRGAQKEFPDMMAKKTVVNRVCTKLINSSSDNQILLESFNRSTDGMTEDSLVDELEQYANKEFLETDEPKEEIKEEILKPVSKGKKGPAF